MGHSTKLGNERGRKARVIQNGETRTEWPTRGLALQALQAFGGRGGGTCPTDPLGFPG